MSGGGGISNHPLRRTPSPGIGSSGSASASGSGSGSRAARSDSLSTTTTYAADPSTNGGGSSSSSSAGGGGLTRRRPIPTSARAAGKQPVGSYAAAQGQGQGYDYDYDDHDHAKGQGDEDEDDDDKGRRRGPRSQRGTSAAPPGTGGVGLNGMVNDWDAWAGRAQGRLEAWFGLGEGGGGGKAQQQKQQSRTSAHGNRSSTAPTSGKARSAAGSSAEPPNTPTPTLTSHSAGRLQAPPTASEVLVYIHPVQPHETLAGIALAYGIEPAQLRRVNKLWAGDKPQMRGQLYVPVDACSAASRAAAAGAGAGAGGMDGSSRAVSPAGSSSAATGAGASNRGNDSGGVLFGFWNEERGLVRKAEPQQHAGGAGGMPLQEGHLRQHDRSDSSGASAGGRGGRRAAEVPTSSSLVDIGGISRSLSSRSHTSSSAATSSAVAASAVVQRVPKEELQFFGGGSTPGAAADADGRKGAAAPGGGGGYGQTGLDDLLQISAERNAVAAAASSTRWGDEDASETPRATGDLLSEHLRAREEEANRNKGASAAAMGTEEGTHSEYGAASTAYSDRLLDENWKPNKWTLNNGQKQKRLSRPAAPARAYSEQSAHSEASSSQLDSSSARNHHIAAITGLVPHAITDEGGVLRASAGWNDVPPPPGANVAHAYSGKRSGKGARSHHRLLNDLVSGLPPNTGAASGWQRPIAVGASLPPPPPGVRHGGASSAAAGASSAGLGKLLNDTFRGRISVEGALEAVYDQVTGKAPPPPPSSSGARRPQSSSASSSPGPGAFSSLPPHRTDLRSNGSSMGRVSAEEARASLSSARGIGGAGDLQIDMLAISGGAGDEGSQQQQQRPSGPRRVRSRVGLKDVEWHLD